MSAAIRMLPLLVVAAWPAAALGQSGQAEPQAAGGTYDTEKAKTFYKLGKELYAEGKYTEALAAFTEAYNLSSNADLLFNLGACSERMGDREKAVAYYEVYLEERPEAPDASEVRKRIEALKAPTPAPRSEAPAPQPVDSERIVDEKTQAADAEERGVFWPGLTIGAGGLVLVAGGLTAGMAYKEYRSLESSCSPDCTDGDIAAAKDMALAADILFAAGGALVAAGAIWWIVGDDGESAVSIRALPSGLSIAGRF